MLKKRDEINSYQPPNTIFANAPLRRTFNNIFFVSHDSHVIGCDSVQVHPPVICLWGIAYILPMWILEFPACINTCLANWVAKISQPRYTFKNGHNFRISTCFDTKLWISCLRTTADFRSLKGKVILTVFSFSFGGTFWSTERGLIAELTKLLVILSIRLWGYLRLLTYALIVAVLFFLITLLGTLGKWKKGQKIPKWVGTNGTTGVPIRRAVQLIKRRKKRITWIKNRFINKC